MVGAMAGTMAAVVSDAEPSQTTAPNATQPLERTAGRTGLEPAASGVTGRRYNRLNYRPKIGLLLLS